jgi:hypothetical protein
MVKEFRKWFRGYQGRFPKKGSGFCHTDKDMENSYIAGAMEGAVLGGKALLARLKSGVSEPSKKSRCLGTPNSPQEQGSLGKAKSQARDSV